MPSRCFLALGLPSSIVGTLGRAGEAFVEHAPEWRGEKWVRPELLHVTLEFIGPIGRDDVPRVVSRMEDAASGIAGFGMGLRSVEAAPSAPHAAMLWATVDDSAGSVALLRRRLVAALGNGIVQPGEGPRTRSFRPHVTLVRARRARPAPSSALVAARAVIREMGKTPDGIMSVRSATLFSSTLTSTGPEYRAIATILLGR